MKSKMNIYPSCLVLIKTYFTFLFSRTIRQLHYIHWPDFNVPDCPDAFLDFLYAVRDSGAFMVLYVQEVVTHFIYQLTI